MSSEQFALLTRGRVRVVGTDELIAYFARDIAPIIYQNCAPCHRTGETAPFAVLTSDDVKKHARQIAIVTRTRYMPPWPPQPGYGDFQNERRLTETQIRLIAEWVKAGTPEGPAAEIPPPPHFTSGWQSVRLT
jgi:mono/diheme cytochrome c family protein